MQLLTELKAPIDASAISIYTCWLAILCFVYRSCRISRNNKSTTQKKEEEIKRQIQKYTQFTADKCIRKVLRFGFVQKTRLINTECHHTLTEKCGVSPFAYHKDDVVVSAVVNSPFAVFVSLFHSSTHSFARIHIYVLQAYAIPPMPLVLFLFISLFFFQFHIFYLLFLRSAAPARLIRLNFILLLRRRRRRSFRSVWFTRIMFRNSSQFVCVSFSLRSTTTSNFDRRMHTIAWQRSVAYCSRSANMLRREE